MEEQCPLCFRKFPVTFLERHVNSCLDTHHPEETRTEEKRDKNVFAALGLKADSKRPEKSKKDATLTSILIAERKLKRRQEELERRLLKRPREDALNSSPVSEKPEKEKIKAEAQDQNGQRPTLTQMSDAPSQTQASTQTQAFTQETQRIPVQEHSTQNHSSLPSQNHSSLPSQGHSSALSQANLASQDQRQRNREFLQLKREAALPLAQRLRPKTLDDFFGQEKLVGPNGILRNIMASQQIPSFILWGVPGVGKTSLARIIASNSNHRYVELSGSESSAKKLKEAFANAQNEQQLSGTKTILFLDEIHRFNKAVQDLLLPVIEKGVVTVIGATTENPSFTLNNALLSRMHTFVMEPLSHEALVKILNKGLLLVNKTRKIVHGLHLIAMNKEAIDHIARLSTGDSRVALNILESVNAYLSGRKYNAFPDREEGETIDVPEKIGIIKVDLENLKPLLATRNFHQMYDKVGENHYDTISAFHKSVRGSDADAAVFYLVKMLSGGEDPLFIARRMIVIASEDIGLRDSSCLPFAISAMEAVQFVGMPEGEIILAHCAVKLARAPKSTKSYRALRTAQELLKEKPEVTKLPIPLHIRNAPTKLMKELGYGESYKYNPFFKHGIAKQTFMPPEIQDVKFVEDTHLGTIVDEDEEKEKYDKADAEEQEYRKFKEQYRSLVKEEKRKLGRASRRKNLESIKSLYSAERMSSYDENLDKSDQPEYFDGSERDNYSDDPDCHHNFECSYDEFQQTPEKTEM
ncbi:MgsA AAA+ ATPase C terminal family protein [Clavispora lusitaniae]|uniref:MgsA AAA+ ATPase C terminal family protein n=1 Tax=Clavispora lusitaniae TaxID=36911 RepID=UPI00202C965B|nr:MgsA AAA+ ATPase C terminal family protein [Clavispora lusitaniae]